MQCTGRMYHVEPGQTCTTWFALLRRRGHVAALQATSTPAQRKTFLFDRAAAKGLTDEQQAAGGPRTAVWMQWSKEDLRWKDLFVEFNAQFPQKKLEWVAKMKLLLGVDCARGQDQRAFDNFLVEWKAGDNQMCP